MKIKRKRSKRSRIRGRRTCGYGSRKKHRGKGSKGGKGMAGTGKRAGQKLTWLQRYMPDYLGKRGFVSHKKLKRLKKQKVISLDEVISKFYMEDKETIDLSGYKIVGKSEKIDFIKGKKIICEEISKRCKEFLEKNGIEVITKNVKEIGEVAGSS
jgi:large subunit ribosomal protein L15